jgi:ABC-type sugar transport system ATPase subunit
MPKITLDNISKTYGDHIVLNDVNLSIETSGFYSIVGESGSGKTTLLNLIAGLEKPTSGKIVSDCRISIVFQDSNLLNDFSVLDNIKMVGIGDDEAQKLLKELNLENVKNTEVRLLSGGESKESPSLGAWPSKLTALFWMSRLAI